MSQKTGFYVLVMQSVSEKSYARIGLTGNPSDGYGGKTLSVICKNFCATVSVKESARLVLVPDAYEFESVSSLQASINQDGYYGAARLFKATLKVFAEYVEAYCDEKTLARSFTISYQTDIPRMVGLSGSSALIVATLKALMKFFDVQIDPLVLPSLALTVERDELNIGGGLQDRVIQFYEGLVAMDFSEPATIDGFVCGHYRSLDPALLPDLYMAFSTGESEPTEVFHNDLKTRYQAGESLVVDAMTELAKLSEQSVAALEQGAHETFSALMDQNFDIRRSISNLNPQHVAMIETARSCGVSAKYAGSGGAIVGVCTEDQDYQRLCERLKAQGCQVIRPVVV